MSLKLHSMYVNTAAGVIRVLMVNYKTMSVIKNSALFLPIIITIVALYCALYSVI